MHATFKSHSHFKGLNHEFKKISEDVLVYEKVPQYLYCMKTKKAF